ncbi:MAG: hypothetical protein K6U89_19115 [Chloroflexi bacterium]|nr:hypothetical protein [Chloroflexota bacterium]
MPGTIWEADQYTGVAGPSTIAPNGPWDFTTVAGTPSPLKQTIVDRQRAANAEVFPNATYVMQNEPAGAGEVPNRYRYLEIRPDGLYWLGDSNGAEPFKPEAPQRLLALPAHPGERWETAYTDDRFGRVRIASRYEIAGCGPLTTPLGTFERAVLVKTEVTIAETRSAATVYTWHVPGVGQVVTISNSALAPDSAAIVVVKRFQRP